MSLFSSSRFAHSCLGGLALGAVLFSVVPGCSSADIPAETKDTGVSASQLSGRYEPGSPDTAWLWFDGTSAVRGVNRKGTTFEGAYAIEKVSTGYDLVLKLKDGQISRYPFKPGKTFRDEQKANSALGTGNVRVRADKNSSANEGCPTATDPNPEPDGEVEPASRTAYDLRPATGSLLSGCVQLLPGLDAVLSAMTTGDGVESKRTAGTPKAPTIAANTGDQCQLVGHAPCEGCAGDLIPKQSGTACYCCFPQ